MLPSPSCGSRESPIDKHIIETYIKKASTHVQQFFKKISSNL